MAMGEVAKPLCHLTVALQSQRTLARMKHRLCHWQGSVSLGPEGCTHSLPPWVSHSRLPEVAGPSDSENISGFVVEFSGSVPPSEEERSYLAPTKCG